MKGYFEGKPLVIFQKEHFLERAPCAGFSCQAEKERRAAWVHVEVIPGTKMNLHALGATSRARFRPSSLSARCREPPRVTRLLNDTLMLLHLKAFCVKTNGIRKKRFYRTYCSIRLCRKNEEIERKKGLLNFCISLPTKTFAALVSHQLMDCVHVLDFYLSWARSYGVRRFTPSSQTPATITYFLFFFRHVL